MKVSACFALALLASLSVRAENASPDPDADLATQLANPVASLIVVPLQTNYDFGIGPNDATRLTMNFQPVIPFSLNDDWNLIVRTIVPYVDAESPAPGIDHVSGFSDTVQSFFFSPKEPVGGWILATGPVLLWPTATDEMLGGQWGAGPTALALKQSGPWTYGLLANHLWSYAGEDSRPDVNATFLQPFCSYITPTKTTFTVNAESAHDWTTGQWSVPVNFVVSQLFKINRQPMQGFVGVRYHLEGPDGGPDWGLRFGLSVLFPR